jgi:hypothetical protein
MKRSVKAELGFFQKRNSGFFKGFEAQKLSDLSEAHIQKQLDAHELSANDLLNKYSRRLLQRRRISPKGCGGSLLD